MSWTKTEAGRWQHTSGAIVLHCGHPTALWPYYGYQADGVRFGETDEDGKFYGCYRHLHEAKAAALDPNSRPKENNDVRIQDHTQAP